MKHRTPFFFSFLVLLLFSCSKDAVNSNGTKLVRVLLNGTIETEYFYDDAGRMTRWVSYGFGIKIGTEVNNTYDNAGRLVKQNSMSNLSSSSVSGAYSYSYTDYSYGADGRLAESVTYTKINNAAYQFASKSIPTYDVAGRTVALTLTDANNVPFAKRTYAYNAQSNVSVEEFFQYSITSPGPSTHVEYSYDDKKNPYEGNWLLPYGANKNNITERKVTSYFSLTGAYIPAGLAPVTSKASYKSYTSNGYPAIVDEYSDGTDRVYEYN